LGDEITSDEISRKELELDKEIIQLIQNACKHDKPLRVLELANMLHHTPSLDMAVKVADFYHYYGLQEKLLMLKEDREGYDDPREAAQKQRRQWKRDSAPVPPPRQSSHSEHQPAKPFQDFGPPPAVHRPGLARATPGAGDPSKPPATSFEPLSETDDDPHLAIETLSI
jgi:chromosome transmission fidelity protein 4